MKKYSIVLVLFLALVFIGFVSISCSEINTVGDSHFSSDGELLIDSANIDSFKLIPPARIKYYIESSGSMNGFFRPNLPTQFKTDIWGIMSYFSAIPSEVTILTNNGDAGVKMTIDEFRQHMNTGSFVSSASTQVPIISHT